MVIVNEWHIDISFQLKIMYFTPIIIFYEMIQFYLNFLGPILLKLFQIKFLESV